MYRIDLDLTKEQVKQLKQIALTRDLPVRGLVTKLVIKELEDKNKKEEKTKP